MTMASYIVVARTLIHSFTFKCNHLCMRTWATTWMRGCLFWYIRTHIALHFGPAYLCLLPCQCPRTNKVRITNIVCCTFNTHLCFTILNIYHPIQLQTIATQWRHNRKGSIAWLTTIVTLNNSYAYNLLYEN